MKTSLWRRWWPSARAGERSRPVSRGGPLRPRLHLEQLEDRTLLSGTPQLLADINPGSGPSYPSQMVVVGSTTYFAANDGTHGYELWKSDGTAAGTSMVADINFGNRVPYFTNVNGELFFTAYDGTHGYELWKSDGTTAGTSMVKDIFPGYPGGSIYPNNSNPSQLTNVNGTLYFTANDGTTGAELWKSDGTAAGTTPVADINPGSGTSYPPQELTNVNGELFFTAYDGTHGTELWKSDGTVAGTTLVKDVYPGSSWVNGYYGPFYVVNSSSPSNLTNVNGTLYFSAYDGHGNELWKSDGTAAGTSMVKDIFPGYPGGSIYPNSSNPSQLTNVNGTLYFTANDGTTGAELWKSDGTAAGTTPVADINPGSGASSPQKLTNVNGELFFTANDGTTGEELWKSDGTTAGTTLVADINPGTNTTWYYTGVYGTFTKTVTTTGSTPFHLTSFNGTLYFTANDGTHGYELWKSDGTTAGTTLVADINPGSGTHSYTEYSWTRSATLPNSSFPSNLTNLNGTLLFSADDGAHGNELWELPGGATSPPIPTVRVNDVTVTEGNTGTRAATFTVTLSAASTQPVTVSYATSNGSATAGSDYTAVSGTLIIPAGQTTGTIAVLVNGDRLAEPNETFVVNLLGATNATIADDQGVGTIVDDEPRITIGDVTRTEGNTGTTPFVFTVSLSAAYDAPVTVSFATANGTATAGSDYQATSGTLTIPPGQTSGTISVLVNGDRLPEPSESFSVNLSNPVNAGIADGQGIGTIVDDEPRISISDVTKYEGKKGQTTLFTFTVTLSATYDQAVTMSFGTVNGTATSGSGDYVAKTGTLTFNPGETTKTITIEVKGDGQKEADETFYLDLSGNSLNSLFTKKRGTGTILNDD